MKEPKYTVNTFIETLKRPQSRWLFNDNRNEENFYKGEAFEVLESNKSIHKSEIKGKIVGNKFFSLNGNYEGLIKDEFHEEEALAVKAIDGVVVVLKELISYIDEKRVEGYWHSVYTPQYKEPVPNQLSESEVKGIFKLIKEKEKECRVKGYRGYSTSRIDNTQVGREEYHHDSWLWPEGFAEHYVLKYRVKPSDAFLKFIGWNS